MGMEQPETPDASRPPPAPDPPSPVSESATAGERIPLPAEVNPGTTEAGPAEAAAPEHANALPDPGMAPKVPDEYRLPFHGKMTPPTATPSASERRANLDRIQKVRKRKGFLIGLLVGQLLVIGLDFGGKAILDAIAHKYKFNAPIPLQSLVFLGMAGGIAITAVLILFVLGFQGVGYVFGSKQVGFFTAVGRGIRRVFKAAWSLGLTLGVIGGTAWFMIPGSRWKDTTEYMKLHGDKAVQGARGWAEDFLKPKSRPPENP